MTLLEQCRIEVMQSVANAIASSVEHIKSMHGANDPEMSRLIVGALLDAILEETKDDDDLRNRSAEVLLLYSDDED